MNRVFSPYRIALEETVSAFGLPVHSLQIVDSIKQYCADIGYPELEQNEGRAAKCLISDAGEPTFLLCDLADPVRLVFWPVAREFPKEDLDMLNEPHLLAMHQLLHEISHYVRRDAQRAMTDDERERDADAWAFEHLKRLTRR